ncbi:MAG: polysaccharide biosynthesis tyrosine autokinase [Planctomycetes bacterium]|nr:polysaccharide biosynthesis tyrosine autokinase [Planctomycetota bacterium]
MSTSSDGPAMDPTTTQNASATAVLNDPTGDALITRGGTALLDPRTESRSARPAILNATPKPLELLLALQRRWLFALTLALALGIPAAVVTWFAVKDTYETYSLLRVRVGPGLIYTIDTGLMSLDGQRKLIASPIVINEALSYPGISNLPEIKARSDNRSEVEWLGQQIYVRSYGSGGGGGGMGDLLQIGMKGEDPKQLEALVNAMTKAYIEKVAGEERRMLLARQNLLDSTYTTKSQEVNRRRDLVRTLAERLGTGDSKTAQAKQQLLLDFILNLRKEITDTRSAVFRKQLELEQFKRKHGFKDDVAGAQKGPIPDGLVDEAVSDDSEYRIRLETIQKLEEKLAKILEVSKDPNSPSVRNAREAIVKAQEMAAERKKIIRQRLQQEWDEGKIVHRTKAEYDALVNEIEGLKAKETAMNSQFEELNKTMQDLGTSSEELERRKEDLAAVVSTANKLVMTLEQYDLELRSPDRVALLQSATEPRAPLGNSRWKYTALAGLGAVGIGLGLVSLWEFHARRITSKIEVNEGLGVRVIGDVPMLSQGTHHWWGHSNGNSESTLQGVMDESIDGVRAMLLHSAGGDTVRVVMVTSAKAGEGKTTVSVSLAASLGRCGRRTLLIDGDLRRPNVHRLLDMPLDKGLAEVLRGEATLQEVIRPSRAPGMWVMSAGHCDQISLQALTKNILAQLFETLRTEFDSIVVDTGPVLAVVDPLLLGQHCDGAILSIVHRVSQITPVYDTCERLKDTGIRVLGCVVNGTPRGAFGLNQGYYGYGYGYGHVHANGSAGEPAPPMSEST